MPEYFRCDPHSLCKGAACCTTPETDPALNLGDYFRLSKGTGESMESIWLTKGDICMVMPESLEPGTFAISLGLLHDPCPYLSSELRCSVYDNRPTACVEFPTFLLSGNNSELGTTYMDYDCLHGVELKPGRIDALEELRKLYFKESEREFRILWKGKPHHICLPGLDSLLNLSSMAFEKQRVRDPKFKTPRGSKVIASSGEVAAMRKRAMWFSDELVVDAENLVRIVKPLLYSLYQDDIADRLAKISKPDCKFYSRTSRDMRELHARFSD